MKKKKNRNIFHYPKNMFEHCVRSYGFPPPSPSRFVILQRQSPRACYCILIEEFYTRFFPRCRDPVYAVRFAAPTNLNASRSWYPALMMPQLLHYWERAFRQIPSASRRVTAACPPRNPIISLANTQFAETSLSHRRLHSASVITFDVRDRLSHAPRRHRQEETTMKLRSRRSVRES